MKVSEFIERLNEFPPDAEVALADFIEDYSPPSLEAPQRMDLQDWDGTPVLVVGVVDWNPHKED